MLSNTPFRVNSPSVIGEVLDGEAIIVNLDSGAYYSLNGAGAELWMTAQTGATLAQLIELIAARYQGAADEIAAGVTALVAELMAEGLLATSNAAAAAAEPFVAAAAGPRPPFVRPILEKFTDMADLLLLDPIHEVDEAAGWPQPAPTKR